MGNCVRTCCVGRFGDCCLCGIVWARVRQCEHRCLTASARCGRDGVREDAPERTQQPLLLAADRRGGGAVQGGQGGLPHRERCDYAGFRTLDTVVRAKKVFGLDSFIIVSQPDHVRRAVFTARGFGCDAYGYAAEDVNGRYSIKTTIREQLAKIAAVLDVILRRSPKFLGPRETLPPPVEEGDVLNPPENREPTSGTVAVDPSVYNVLQILREV